MITIISLQYAVGIAEKVTEISGLEPTPESFLSCDLTQAAVHQATGTGTSVPLEPTQQLINQTKRVSVESAAISTRTKYP